MLKRTLRCTLPYVLFFIIAICAQAISNGQELTRITPKWAIENPGRLEFSYGAAFNGSNGYTFRLLTNERRRFSVRTRVSRPTDKGPRPLFETNAESNGVKKFVLFNATVWPSENLNVEFVVVEEEPVFKDGKISGYKSSHEYDLRLADFLKTSVKLPVVDFKAVGLEARDGAVKKPQPRDKGQNKGTQLEL